MSCELYFFSRCENADFVAIFCWLLGQDKRRFRKVHFSRDREHFFGSQMCSVPKYSELVAFIFMFSKDIDDGKGKGINSHFFSS
ncbi:hypothetical protein D3C85_1256430 [compost metagenome]